MASSLWPSVIISLMSLRQCCSDHCKLNIIKTALHLGVISCRATSRGESRGYILCIGHRVRFVKCKCLVFLFVFLFLPLGCRYILRRLPEHVNKLFWGGKGRMLLSCDAVWPPSREPALVNNIKGWGCGWKHNLCDAVVCSAFRRHIDAQLFWSISPSEQRPSLSLRPGACEKWGREESVHFNLSLALRLGGRARRWEQEKVIFGEAEAHFLTPCRPQKRSC